MTFMAEELIWINGETVSMSEAGASIEDRGSQFADGVYEVIRLYDGKPFTLDEHLERLRKSATSIQIAMPLAPGALADEIRKFIPKSGVTADSTQLDVAKVFRQRVRYACLTARFSYTAVPFSLTVTSYATAPAAAVSWTFWTVTSTRCDASEYERTSKMT